MSTIEQLLQDIRDLRKVKRSVEDGPNRTVNDYILANAEALREVFRVVYKEHTKEEREKAYKEKVDRDCDLPITLDPSAISHDFYGLLLAILDQPTRTVSNDVTDDDLNMLTRGIQFGRKFGAVVQGPLVLSPVRRN